MSWTCEHCGGCHFNSDERLECAILRVLDVLAEIRDRLPVVDPDCSDDSYRGPGRTPNAKS